MTLRSFKAILAALALFAPPVLAQQQVPQFTDPANLRGERVKPRDGRELPIDQGARGLEQMLRKLNTRASLMLIVAHPDDEDGGMLTYYSRGLGARVAVLTLTRGEGGQNAMTGDFEDALGLLRTQELLSADRYLGVDQFFGTEVDFGFSKTKEEAFKKWTHERVLYDAVRSIRLYRPLVIAAVFIGGVTDGHGQHQVSGQIAQEAFKAAADPTVFPDMIAEGILPWQALKVYARVPMQSISSQGLYDYATGKYTAPRFQNYVTGEITTTVPSSDVIVHEGTTDKLLSDDPAAPPRTYVQFARIGLGMQKSQIGGGVRVPPAGTFDVAYHLYGSALCTAPNTPKGCHPERSEGSATPSAAARPLEASSQHPESASFFDGIDTSIMGLREYHSVPADILSRLAGKIDNAEKNFDPAHLESTASTLADALKICDELIRLTEQDKSHPREKANALHEFRIKRIQLNDALALAIGISVSTRLETDKSDECTRAIFSFCIAHVQTLFTNGPATIHVISDFTSYTGEAPSERSLGNAELRPGQRLDPTISWFEHSFDPSRAPVVIEHPAPIDPFGIEQSEGRPYFNRSSIEQPFYDLLNPSLRLAPQTPPQSFWTRFSYAGTELLVGHVVTAAATANDPGVPLVTQPSVSVAISPGAVVAPRNNSGIVIAVSVHSDAPPRPQSDGQIRFYGEVRLNIPHEAPSQRPTASLPFDHPGQTLSIPFKVSGFKADGLVSASAEAIFPWGTITEGVRAIGYPGITPTNYYTPATVRIVPVDLNLPSAHNIAYFPGTGDAVPEALASINLKPDILTLADLTPGKLAGYDTVILGVRTYAAHPDLHGAPTQALLDYARNGGNVLVQYQTTEFTAADAPYPLSMGSNEKVVDETDPVQLLPDANASSAPFLTTPNKITPADFNDWVEERGHGFLSSWDSHYTALTETHDPDQDPQRGGLITTPLGKGRWTYCAFALYRQLPEAVPGAFRLFVNLITPTTNK